MYLVTVAVGDRCWEIQVAVDALTPAKARQVVEGKLAELALFGRGPAFIVTDVEASP